MNEEPSFGQLCSLIVQCTRCTHMGSDRLGSSSASCTLESVELCRRRQAHAESKHVLYDVGSDESDEDEDESE